MLKKAPNTTNFKFKKFHKIKYSSNMLANNTFYLQFGLFGLQSLETASMTAKHIETGRIMLRKFMKKKGKIWIKVFPWAAITKKPVGARMGKGKGKHFKWIVPLKKGTIIYEIAGISQSKAYLALLKCGLRMPFRFKIVKLKY